MRSSSTTSASVVSPKSRYHWPTATKSAGWRGHTTSSASAPSSATVSGGPTGTATTTRRRVGRAHGADGGAHRRPGRQPVVDEHDDATGERRARAITAQPPVAVGQLALGDVDARRHVGLGAGRAGRSGRRCGRRGRLTRSPRSPARRGRACRSCARSARRAGPPSRAATAAATGTPPRGRPSTTPDRRRQRRGDVARPARCPASAGRGAVAPSRPPHATIEAPPATLA